MSGTARGRNSVTDVYDGKEPGLADRFTVDFARESTRLFIFGITRSVTGSGTGAPYIYLGGVDMRIRNLVVILTLLMLFLAASWGVAAKTTITFWHEWGPNSDIDKAFQEVAREFEKRNPDIQVKVIATGLGEAGLLQKLAVQIAGGVPPDVCQVNEKVSSYVLSKLPQPLDSFLERDKIEPSDFWAPSFRECVWEDKVWALPFGSDPNFGFFCNKGMFGQAGIPENQPPKTIADLNLYNQKLAKRDSKGNLTQFGCVPWWTYGYPNSIYTWGWAFGGEFYDPKTRKITADDPKIVKALSWMCSMVDLYGGLAAFDALNQGLATDQSNFTAERIAMAAYGPWELPRILKYGPHIEFGITSVPYDPDGGQPNPTWVGGHKFIIPAGVKNKEAAWKFLKFIAADPEGTAILAKPLRWFPGYKKSDIYDVYRKDRNLAPFVMLLETSRHQRPVMPAAEFYYWQLDKAVAAALSKQKTPLAALKDAVRATQVELDKILSRAK